MKDTELYTVTNMSSSSSAMFERRRRILNEARKLLQNGQPDGFSVRELCNRANVAPNTLYNAFGNKENVIGLALSQYADKFNERVDFVLPRNTFEGALERDMATIIGSVAIPNYVRAMAGLFFSPSSSPALNETLVNIAGRLYLPWLEELRISREIEKGVDFERVATNLSAIFYAQVRSWGPDQVCEETHITDRLDATLTYLSGVTKGGPRKRIRALLIDLHGPRQIINELATVARNQLAVASDTK